MNEREEYTERAASHSSVQGEETIDLVAWLYRILAHWYWFAASVILMLLAGWFYLRYTTPIYKTTAKLLVVDEKRGGGMMAGGIMDDFGGMLGMKSNVDNEVEVLKTYDLMPAVY